MSTQTREIQLAARPHGEPKPSDFRLVETTLPDPGPGEVLVRNLAMSVDPYMRGRMSDAPSYAAPWQLERAADGAAVGEVIAAGDADQIGVGTLVLHQRGLARARAVAGSAGSDDRAGRRGFADAVSGRAGDARADRLRRPVRVAALQPGESVFVSGAAGAVGGLVGQFARLAGAGRVIGSAGSAEKVAFLTDELGFDAAFDYHDGPVRRAAAAGRTGRHRRLLRQRRRRTPGGGDRVAKLHGRVALCGAISTYNATEPPPGPRNLGLLVGRRLRLQGFLVSDHQDLRPEFVQRAGGWFSSGELVARETVVHGLDSAVSAFIGMLRGANTGKMVVTLND